MNFTNKIVLSLIVAIFAVLVSCGSKQESVQVESKYDLSDPEDGAISDVFNNVEAVPLLFEGEHYPKNIMKATVADDYVFIYDINGTLYIFSKEGRYIADSSNKIGQGPGEYSIMMDYSWNPYSKLIEILTPNRLIFYDKDFNFVKSCPVPSNIKKEVIFGQVEDLSVNEHVLLPTGVSKDPYRICFFDSDTQKITREFSYEKDVIAPTGMSTRTLFHEGDSIMFCPPVMTGYVYGISDNELKSPVIEFMYGKNTISESDVKQHDSSEEDLRNYLVTSKKNIPMSTLITSRKIFTTLKHGNKITDTYVVATDRSSHESLSLNINSSDGNEKIFPFIYDVDSGHAYSIVDKATLLDSPKLMLDNAERIAKLISNIDDEDFVLLKYEVK